MNPKQEEFTFSVTIKRPYKVKKKRNAPPKLAPIDGGQMFNPDAPRNSFKVKKIDNFGVVKITFKYKLKKPEGFD